MHSKVGAVLFLTSIVLSFSIELKAQYRICATDHFPAGHIDGNAPPDVIKTRLERSQAKKLTIPVVVHIIHNDMACKPDIGNSSNITDEQVYSQIKVLNEDFRRMENTNGFSTNPVSADTEIEFCLASTDPQGMPCYGINRVYNEKSTWNLNEEEQLKSLSYWPSDSYLNIWVANINVYQGFGYARYPTGTSLRGFPVLEDNAAIDGVVIHYKAFGTKGTAVAPYNLGRTTTHEVGHWLGLLHVWGPTDSPCDDDYVSDTPSDERPNDDLDCDDYSYCSDEMVKDNTSNYLDFSPDHCMNMFTLGQKERMWAALTSSPRRVALFQSSGCSGSSLQKMGFRTYPNPASTTFYIKLFGTGCQSAELEFYNAQGTWLMGEKIEGENAKEYTYDVSHWEEGLYFLKITHEGNKKTVKIIVQH